MNLKKIVSLVLAMVMLLGLITVGVEAESAQVSMAPDYTVVNMNKAPQMDGLISESEYGKPIITATQADTSGTGKVKFVLGKGVANANQKATIYMVADEQYLYVAATLNHAQKNGYTTVSAYCPQLCVTLAEYDSETNSVPLANNVETSRAFRLLYEKNATTAKVWSKLYIGSSTSQPAIAAETSGQTYFTKYESGTYTYEMRIAWDTVPGMSGQDYKNGKPFAMTIRLNDAINTGSTACYYQIGGGAAGGTVAAAKPHTDNGFMTVAGGEWCYVSDKVAPMSNLILPMDGSDPTNEWGNPVIVTSPEHAKNNWSDGYAKGTGVTQDNKQRAKVYMTNDSEYLYVAATLDHALASTNANAKSGYVPLLAVSVSQYGEGGVYKVDNKEQFRFFRLYLMNGEAKIWSRNYSDGKDAGGVSVASDCYYAGYDETAQTYTFKMKIAWNTIPGMSEGILNASPIAMTVRIGDANLGTADTHGNSYYQIGGKAAGLGGKESHSHGALKMDINPIVGETPYVSDVASAGQDITVDGDISQSEWGAPVAVLAPTSANFFNQDKEHNTPDQRAKVYLSNDDKYIYVGATLNRSDKGINFTGTSAWKYPLFWFTLSEWDDNTTVKRVNGTEQYTSYRFNFAEPSVCMTMSQNIAGNIALSDEDWKVVYDASTRTYTYEARIPLSATNIRYTESLDVAFSAQVGTSLFAADKENDRYNLGLAPANYPAQEHRHEGDNRAVKITLNRPSWLAEGNYVKDTVAEKQGDIVMDANVTTGEWGEPIIVTGPDFAKGYWSPDGYWSREAVDPNQLAKVYMTNDANYLYIAATLDHAEFCVNENASNESLPQMTVTLSRYNPYTTVARVDGKEQFSSYRIGWNMGGEIKATVSANQLGSFTLSDSDWAVRYDAVAKTYTYELRIPFSTTNINIHETSQLAASIQIGDSNYGVNGNNCYNIGGAGAANRHQADTAGNYPHLGQAMKLNLRQQYYVADQLSNPNDKIKIDGKINVSEWGAPTIVTNPNHTQTTWGSFETNEPSCVDQSQTARVWLTSDEHYLYVGATLDKAAAETKGKNTSGTTLTNVMRSHFMFDIGRYVEDTTVPRSTYKGEKYENYTGYILWLDNNGNPRVTCRSLGMDKWTPDKSSFAVAYDDATGTYTYEIRIPYQWTQIQPYGSDVVFCGSLGTPYMGEGTSSNRYHFETGHTGGQKGGDEPHKGHMIKLALNTPDFGVVNDAVSPFSGKIAIDGTLDAGEWGEPLIVTNPAHAKGVWGALWNVDKATLDHLQTVKIYATNDAENLYFAATVDRTDFDDSDLSFYARAHFYISVGRHDDQTDMERIVSQRKTYERLGMYRLCMNAEGKQILLVEGVGTDVVGKQDCEYAIVYDETTRTYTYEIRIPIDKTTLRFGNNDQMQVCFTAAPAYKTGDAATRYNIGGTGTAYASNTSNKFAHTGQSLTVKLNPNAYTEPLDVYSLDDVNPNYIKNTGKNPNSGDIILSIVAVAWISACGVIVTLAMRKRRFGK